MAKSFLDMLDDGYDDHVLSDLIPGKKKPSKASSLRKSENTTATKAKKPNRARKKSFLRNIEQNIGESTPKRVSPASTKAPRPTSKKKSFLETIEEAYDQSAFDDLIPDRKWAKREKSDFSDEGALERKFGSMVTPAVLARVRAIAKSKGVSVQDVIQRAIELYLSNET